MRTTVVLDDDVAAAVKRLRQEASVGLSEALNRLVRAGLLARDRQQAPFQQQTRPMRLKIDVTNVAEALETLDGPSSR
jgi:hypothetical protein